MVGSYGHSLPPVILPELLKFNNYIICDGVNGGSGGEIHMIWIPDTVTYDEKFLHPCPSQYFRKLNNESKCVTVIWNHHEDKRDKTQLYKYDFYLKLLFQIKTHLISMPKLIYASMNAHFYSWVLEKQNTYWVIKLLEI